MNGILLMLCADVAFAIMASATKFTGERLSAVQIVFVRSALTTLLLSAWCLKNRVSMRPKEPLLLWSRGIVGYVALQCYFWAIPQIALGTAVMLNYTAPIFAVAISILLIGEKPTLTAKISLVISFFGVWLLASPQFGGKPLPLLAGLVSGILAGAVYVMIRHSRHVDGAILVVLYFTMTCTIGSGILLCFLGWLPPSGPEWAGLLLITLSSFAGQLCLTSSLHKAPVWVVSPFGYLTPVMGLLAGLFLWKEIPSPQNLLGSVVVIVCGIAMLLTQRTAR